MFCTQCGSPNQDGRYCSNCGEEIRRTSPSQDSKLSVAATKSPVSEPSTQVEEKLNTPPSPQSEEVETNHKDSIRARWNRLSSRAKYASVIGLVILIAISSWGVTAAVQEGNRLGLIAARHASFDSWFQWRSELRKAKDVAQKQLGPAQERNALAASWGDVEDKRLTLEQRIGDLQAAMAANNMEDMRAAEDGLDRAMSAVGTQADADGRASARAIAAEGQRKRDAKTWGQSQSGAVITDHCRARTSSGSRNYYFSFARWLGNDMIWSISDSPNGIGLVQAIRFTDLGGGTWQIGPTDESPVENDTFNNLGYSTLVCQTFVASQ